MFFVVFNLSVCSVPWPYRNIYCVLRHTVFFLFFSFHFQNWRFGTRYFPSSILLVIVLFQRQCLLPVFRQNVGGRRRRRSRGSDLIRRSIGNRRIGSILREGQCTSFFYLLGGLGFFWGGYRDFLGHENCTKINKESKYVWWVNGLSKGVRWCWCRHHFLGGGLKYTKKQYQY